ncbi:hypothetical protein VNO78_14467 [Psophocarpus tetragonolobus]|uniref:Uncharacterized protein n=1 Tax=Psophocarpus tetragonolobus TaxID=3891 RepID=A0AAN9ST53_PSOTE
MERHPLLLEQECRILDGTFGLIIVGMEFLLLQKIRDLPSRDFLLEDPPDISGTNSSTSFVCLKIRSKLIIAKVTNRNPKFHSGPQPKQTLSGLWLFLLLLIYRLSKPLSLLDRFAW